MNDAKIAVVTVSINGGASLPIFYVTNENRERLTFLQSGTVITPAFVASPGDQVRIQADLHLGSKVDERVSGMLIDLGKAAATYSLGVPPAVARAIGGALADKPDLDYAISKQLSVKTTNTGAYTFSIVDLIKPFTLTLAIVDLQRDPLIDIELEPVYQPSLFTFSTKDDAPDFRQTTHMRVFSSGFSTNGVNGTSVRYTVDGIVRKNDHLLDAFLSKAPDDYAKLCSQVMPLFFSMFSEADALVASWAVLRSSRGYTGSPAANLHCIGDEGLKRLSELGVAINTTSAEVPASTGKSDDPRCSLPFDKQPFGLCARSSQ